MGFLLLDAFAAEFGCHWARDKRVDALCAVHQESGKRVFLLKPQTYVNRSGHSLNAFCGYYSIPSTSLAVVFDEINLPAGRAKITVGGSAGGHNGVADILRFFPNDFVRFRIGIGPKEPPRMDMKDYVLGKLRPEEKEILEGSKKNFLDGLKLLIDSGPQTAMNRVNQRPRDESETTEQPTTSTNQSEETGNEDSRNQEIPGHGDI